jgi:integrase
MNAYPFSIFKRADRPYYSVAFKDQNGKYLTPISTKKKTEDEAVKTAFQWLRDGISQKRAALNVKQLELKDLSKKIETQEEAGIILKELKRRGLLKSFVLADTEQSVPFTEFLLDFWDFDRSQYVKEKLRKSHGIHRSHCERQHQAVKKYWKPVFEGRFLGEITRQDINDFVDGLEDKRLAAQTKNRIIMAGTIALRWAYGKELIESDITKGISLYSGKPKERQILSPELVKALFSTPWKDRRVRLANMLAAVTGLRAGEIQGVRVQDLGKDCLYIRHSWNLLDNLKTTKNNEARTVEVPFSGLIQELLDIACENPWGNGLDNFVFWSERKSDRPMKGNLFLKGLREALLNAGMSRESAGVYCFHSWRHLGH